MTNEKKTRYTASELGAFLHGYMYRMAEELHEDPAVFQDMSHDDLLKMVKGMAIDIIKDVKEKKDEKEKGNGKISEEITKQ